MGLIGQETAEIRRPEALPGVHSDSHVVADGYVAVKVIGKPAGRVSLTGHGRRGGRNTVDGYGGP